MSTVLVTGGAGFIGSHFVRHTLTHEESRVVNLDKLTYAGNLENLSDLADNSRHIFVRGDIGDRELLRRLLIQYTPAAVVHLAAESHVDRSVHGPAEFVRTNVMGTHALLESVYSYWLGLSSTARCDFRFVHVSTDEVYGSLGLHEPPCTERAPYAPNSPYAASKAAADHLVRAYHRTYGLPSIITNCSNNYGPFQYPEKLIPLVVVNGLNGKPIPVYGDGLNIRDWLFVDDHCAALRKVLREGRVGETYNISAANERDNLALVKAICAILDEFLPGGEPREDLITFVHDRPGHDRRYALDASKIVEELGWLPRTEFTRGLRNTVKWYIDSQAWIEHSTNEDFREWIAKNYADRGAA